MIPDVSMEGSCPDYLKQSIFFQTVWSTVGEGATEVKSGSNGMQNHT